MYYRELLETNPNYETESVKIRWLNVPVCLFPPSRSILDLSRYITIPKLISTNNAILIDIPQEHLWICKLMEENMKRLCDSWTPILLEDGYRAEDIQRWKRVGMVLVSFLNERCTDASRVACASRIGDQANQGVQ